MRVHSSAVIFAVLAVSLAALTTVSGADQSTSPIASANYQTNRKLLQEMLDKEPVLYQEIVGGQLTPTGMQPIQSQQGGMPMGSHFMQGSNFPNMGLGQGMGFNSLQYPWNSQAASMMSGMGSMQMPNHFHGQQGGMPGMGGMQTPNQFHGQQGMMPGMGNMHSHNQYHGQQGGMPGMGNMQTPNQFHGQQGMMPNQMRNL